MFFKGSRYEKVDSNQITDSTGRVIVYKKVRFIPDTPGVGKHTVGQVDRLDVIAAQYLGDHELFWRICDANGAMRPEDLLTPVGRVLRICLPAGVPGGPSAP